MNWKDSTDAILDTCMATFGQTVTYVPASGASYSIDGILSNAEVIVDVGKGEPVSSLRPILGVNLSDLAAKPKRGDKVTVGAVSYSIIESQEDGEGGATLVLNKE